MPYGHHLSRCFRCGKEWITGDCIETVCADCQNKEDEKLIADLIPVKTLQTIPPEIQRLISAFKETFGLDADAAQSIDCKDEWSVYVRAPKQKFPLSAGVVRPHAILTVIVRTDLPPGKRYVPCIAMPVCGFFSALVESELLEKSSCAKP